MKKLFFIIPIVLMLSVNVFADDMSIEDILYEYGFTDTKDVWDLCDFAVYMDYKDEIAYVDENFSWIYIEDAVDFYNEYHGMELYDENGDVVELTISSYDYVPQKSNVIPEQKSYDQIKEEKQKEEAKNTILTFIFVSVIVVVFCTAFGNSLLKKINRK